MKYNEQNYNRLVADRLFEWQSDEWIIDSHGNMMLKDELADNAIDTITISPIYSVDDI